MQDGRFKERLAEIQADPATQEFQKSALAQLDLLLNNPPIRGEIVRNADGAEYQRISSDAKNILEKNDFISLLLALANFITNLYRYVYFSFAQPGETEEEAISRGKLRTALLAAIAKNEHTVTECFKLVFNTNQRFPDWKVFPDPETRAEQISSAKLIVEVWQALLFPEDMYPQNTMFSQGQEYFLQTQREDMKEAGEVTTMLLLPQISESEIKSQLRFLFWLVEKNQMLPKPNLSEAKMLYGEIMAQGFSKVGG